MRAQHPSKLFMGLPARDAQVLGQGISALCRNLTAAGQRRGQRLLRRLHRLNHLFVGRMAVVLADF